MKTKSFMAACVLQLLLLCEGSRAYAQDLTKLATDLAAKIHAKNHERVTVVDFLDLEKKPNKLAKFLTHQLQSALNEPELNLVVVDQGHIAELFDQMEKLSEGLIDPATAKKLGKLAGTEVVIYGTVMVSSLSVRLDVSAIDLETAKVIASGTASPKRFGLVDRLAKEIEQEERGAEADMEEEEDPAPVKKAAAKKAPPTSLRDQGVLFEIDGCSLSGDLLTCVLTVISENRDRWMAVGSSSRAWNEDGEEFSPGDLAISNTQVQGRCVAKRILRDVPTNVSLTFPAFGSEESIVERLSVYWAEQDDCCCYESRSVSFQKIALSDGDFSSPKKAGKSGTGSVGNAAGSKKGSGGLFGRLTEKLIETAASTAEKVIDKKARELTGEDEEDPPQE